MPIASFAPEEIQRLLWDASRPPAYKTRRSLVYCVRIESGVEKPQGVSVPLRWCGSAEGQQLYCLKIKPRQVSDAKEVSLLSVSEYESLQPLRSGSLLFRDVACVSTAKRLYCSYDVYPWVSGFTCREWIDRANGHRRRHSAFAELDDAMGVVAAIARALARFQSAGAAGGCLVHGDLKPSNIVIRDGLPLEAILLDYDTVHPDTPNEGIDGSMPCRGTYAYAAPESILHGWSHATSDVYSFGVVAHEVLTGVLPYRFCIKRRYDLSFWRGVHVADDSLCMDGLPCCLKGLVGACLSRDPEKRPCARELPALMEQARFARVA